MVDPFFQNPPQGTPPPQPTVPLSGLQPAAARPVSGAPAQKKGSRISMKTFLIGCGTLFMIVIGGLVLIFYNLIKNPTQLTNLGIDPATTKTLLQTFAAVFFGLLTFLGIAILINNLYRLITVKNKSKLGYIVGATGGFFLFIFGIALGAQILTSVSNISVENIIDSNRLIMPYIQLKDGPKYTRSDPALALIAPATITYTLNTTYFNAQILPGLGQANVQQMTLDCGNGQTLTLNMTTRQFDGSCIYFTKGGYPLNLDVFYINVPTSEKLDKVFSGGTLTINSEIVVTPENQPLAFNDAHTEMSVGKVPSKVSFDASQVFKDLNITDYKIIWDFDGDGTPDKQNQSAATFVYIGAKLYNLTFRLPSLNNYIYTFPLRVEQSDVPVCEVVATKNKEVEYGFVTNFLDTTVQITDYQFDILDKDNGNKIIDTIKSKDSSFNYQFPGKGTYAVQTTFMTEDGKQGQCESDDIDVGATDFQIFYDLNYKSANSPQFQKVLASGDVTINSGVILIKDIPTVLQIQINQIIPDTSTATKKVLLDGKGILTTDGKTFEIPIQDSNDHQITIVVEDTARGTKTEENLAVQVNRADIIGRLIVTPGTVGSDPFTVKFDASTTTLNDPTDEIVYFTWDFGDGVVKKNLSEAIVTHTYTYDTATDNGVYKPILTIQTKNGRQISISPDTNIIVKRTAQTLDIIVESNPGQVANVGDRVTFSLSGVSGLPTEVDRDFGNGKTFKCNLSNQGRSTCLQVTEVYTTPGTYTIRAEVTSADQPTIDGSINLKIQ